MRDIVEFQVEKDTVTEIDETSYERWTFGREQGAADFYSAHSALKTGRKLDGVNRVVDVEGD
jgi:hypothetical protein